MGRVRVNENYKRKKLEKEILLASFADLRSETTDEEDIEDETLKEDLLDVSTCMILVGERRSRRRGWLKLVPFLLFMSLFITMVGSWTDVGRLGSHIRVYETWLRSIKWNTDELPPFGTSQFSKGTAQVTNFPQFFRMARSVVNEIYKTPAPGDLHKGYNPFDETDGATGYGHVLSYVNILRYMRIRKIVAKELNECEVPEWAKGKSSVFDPVQCFDVIPSSIKRRKTTESHVILDLDLGQNATLDTIDSAERDNFFDQSTLVSELEFWAYNMQTHWFTRIVISYQFNVFGFVEFKGHLIDPLRLFPYRTKTDYFVAVLQVIYTVLLILFTLFVLFRRIFKMNNFLKDFVSLWNILDYAATTLGFMGMLTQAIFTFSGGRELLLTNDIPDFSRTSFPSLTRVAMGLGALVYSWKTIEFFDFDPHMNILMASLRQAWTNLAFFALTLFIILLGYALGGVTIIGGTGTENFGSFAASFQSCLAIASGALFLRDLNPPIASHPAAFVAVGLWYWSYIVLVFYILVNMFIAVVLDAYSQTQLTGVPGLVSYSNILTFASEGVRILKQAAFTIITRKPNGRITQTAEDHMYLFLLQAKSEGKRLIPVSKAYEKMTEHPGGERLVDWCVTLCKKIWTAEEKFREEMKLLKKEVRETKRAKKLAALNKNIQE